MLSESRDAIVPLVIGQRKLLATNESTESAPGGTEEPTESGAKSTRQPTDGGQRSTQEPTGGAQKSTQAEGDYGNSTVAMATTAETEEEKCTPPGRFGFQAT